MIIDYSELMKAYAVLRQQPDSESFIAKLVKVAKTLEKKSAKAQEDIMLFSNYLNDQMDAKTYAKVAQHQADLQEGYLYSVERSHSRFYGKFKDNTEFDVLAFSDVLQQALEGENYDFAESVLEDLWLDDEVDRIFPTFHQFVAYMKDTDNEGQITYDHILDLADNLTHKLDVASYYQDDVKFMYDLDNEDDLAELAELEYEEG